MHFGHFGGEMGHRKNALINLVQLHADFTVARLPKQPAHSCFDSTAVGVGFMVDSRQIRQVESDQWRVGGPQNRRLQGFGCLFDQTRHIGGTARGLETKRSAHSKATLVHEQPQG